MCCDDLRGFKDHSLMSPEECEQTLPDIGLQWTQERPTKPGWYWCVGGTGVVKIYSVVSHGERLLVVVGNLFAEMCLFSCAHWAGPIEPPPLAPAEPYEERESQP